MLKHTAVEVAIVALVIALGTEVEGAAQEAVKDQVASRLVYAVTINCGFGSTSVSIYNPNGKAVVLIEQGMPLEFGPPLSVPNDKRTASLAAGSALVMGCSDFAAWGGIGTTGLGNIVIESNLELAVTAVRTSFIAGGGIGDTTFERVRATRVRNIGVVPVHH